MISTFYQKYLGKPIAIFLFLNSASLLDKSSYLPLESKQKLKQLPKGVIKKIRK